MADISIINKDNTNYNVKDAAGRLALAEVENKGAKNLAPNTAKSKTVSTVSFTVNSDGTVLANGTASTEAWFMTAENLTLQPGTYVISGGQKANGTVNVRVVFSTSETAADIIADSNGESTEFTITSATTANVYVRMSTGRTANNVTVYPMICTKAEWDISQAYVPYGKTNAELTAENTSQQSEIDYAINAGVKNLFDINETPIVNHTTYTLTDEKLTVIANGTWAHYSVPIDLPAGNYILSLIISDYSKASGAPDTSIRMRMAEKTSSVTYIVLQTITGNGAINVPFTWTGGTIYLQFYPNFNATAYTNSFSAADVMIRPASITDDTFVPHALPNPTLTPAVIKAVDEGAKNLLHTTAQSQTVNGVTFTVNDDQTITVNGTASETTTYMLVPNTQAILIPDGDYILSGCPNGGGDSTYDLRWYLYSSGKSAYDKGSGASVTKDGNTASSNIAIVIKPGVTASNLVFKPMICTAADWAVSQKFVPYAPTNRELYEEKIDHDLPVVSGSILDYADTLAPGIYFARQSSATGSGKPVNNRRYVYNIYVYSSATATIMAIEGEDPSNPRMFLTSKVSGTWGSWYKFEGTKVT